MQQALLDHLRIITEEEQRILDGVAEVDKDLYTSGKFFSKMRTVSSPTVKFFILFDYLDRFSVCEYCHEDQEYNTLNELHHLCCESHHCQSTVQYDVQ